MDRGEILERYSVVSTADDYVAVYEPLVRDLAADVVTIQTTALDQEGTILMLGNEVLPRLRALTI